MVKRKRKLKGIFGSKFDMWDVFLVLVVIGLSYFIYTTSGFEGALDKIATGVLYALIIGGFTRFVLKRVRR